MKLFKTKTDIQHQQSVASFFPPGNAFANVFNPDTNLGKLITGLAAQIKRMYDDINNISKDYDILVTEAFLSRWESALGIPDAIFPGNTVGDNERRLDILIKFAKMNVQTAQDMVVLIQSLGFQNVDIQPLNQVAFPPYSVPFFPVSPPESRFVISIAASGVFLDVPPYNVPFTPSSNSGGVLNQLMQIVKPTNVEIVFRNPEAAVISPTTFNGAAMWLDAADITTITLGAGNIATAWKDKILDNNATASSLYPKWISTVQNGYGVMRFNNANTFSVAGSTINNILNGDNTCFIMLRQNEGASTGYALSYGAGTEQNGFLRYQDFHLSAGDLPVEATATVTTNFQIIRSRRQGTLQGVAINGVETTNNNGSNPLTPTDNVWIGSNNGVSGYFIGDIAEIIIYSNYLSDKDCSSLENNYLFPKWTL